MVKDECAKHNMKIKRKYIEQGNTFKYLGEILNNKSDPEFEI